MQDVFEFEKILKTKWGFSDEEIRFRKLCNSFQKENQVITQIETTYEKVHKRLKNDIYQFAKALHNIPTDKLIVILFYSGHGV